jgi:hypothetical protein
MSDAPGITMTAAATGMIVGERNEVGRFSAACWAAQSTCA